MADDVRERVDKLYDSTLGGPPSAHDSLLLERKALLLLDQTLSSLFYFQVQAGEHVLKLLLLAVSDGGDTARVATLVSCDLRDHILLRRLKVKMSLSGESQAPGQLTETLVVDVILGFLRLLDPFGPFLVKHSLDLIVRVGRASMLISGANRV